MDESPQSNPGDVPVSALASNPATIQSAAQPNITSKPPVAPKKRVRTQRQKDTSAVNTSNRKRSEAWGHFTILEGTNPIRAACNYCQLDYAADHGNNGTTNLFKHLKKCLKVPWIRQKGQKKLTEYQTNCGFGKGNKSKIFDVNDVRKKLARMVIIDELPFNIVQGEGFREYSNALEPRFKVPSRVTLARDCMKLYHEERKMLKKILNGLVKDGLNEHVNSVVRVGNACKYVRSSPARLRSFKQCVEKEKIELNHLVILDVDTRWNSTYMMLDRAEKYEKVFDRLYKTDKYFQNFFDCYEEVGDEDNILGKRKGKHKEKKIIGPPKKEDWVVVRNFVAFLKIFYNVTLKFFSTLHVTSNIFVPELCSVKKSIDSKKSMQSTSSMYSMAVSMAAKYDKYWSNWTNINHLLFVAVVCDPRFKMKAVHICLDKMYGSNSKSKNLDIEKHLNDLFLHYSMDSSLNDMEPSSPTKSAELMECEGEDIFTMLAREMGEDDNQDTRNEVGRYLSDGIEKGDNLDVLGWWKANSSKYPVLSRIAKDILAIPVSTVASEQAFSTSGRVIDAFRSSLNPKTVEALVCAQNWIRATGTPIEIWESLDEVEKYEDIAQESANSCVTTREDVIVEVDSD